MDLPATILAILCFAGCDRTSHDSASAKPTAPEADAPAPKTAEPAPALPPPPAPAPAQTGPVALGDLTIHTGGGDVTELRLHADGRVEEHSKRHGWRPGPTITGDGRVVHGGREVGRIGERDGMPVPADASLTGGMRWRVQSAKGGVTLRQGDGNTIAMARDGSLRLIIREDGREVDTSDYGTVEGATDHQLAMTAMWIVGLYYGGEVRMW